MPPPSLIMNPPSPHQISVDVIDDSEGDWEVDYYYYYCYYYYCCYYYDYYCYYHYYYDKNNHNTNDDDDDDDWEVVSSVNSVQHSSILLVQVVVAPKPLAGIKNSDERAPLQTTAAAAGDAAARFGFSRPAQVCVES